MSEQSSNNVQAKWGIRSLRSGDFIAVILLLTAAFAWFALGFNPYQVGSIAVVEVSGEEVARIKLNREDYISLRGALGPVLIGVDDTGIRILDSRCPHKLCVKMGAINRAGQWIACVPNKLVIRIEGDSDVDAITPGGSIR